MKMDVLLNPLLILGALAGFGLLHSLLASLAAKGRAQRVAGLRLADGLYRLVFNFIAAITLLPPFALVVLLPDRALYTLPWPLLLITVPMQLATVIGMAVSLIRVDLPRFLGLRQLARLLNGEPDPRDPPRLVTTGLHAWTRHPLYTLSLIFIWLSPVMTVNLLVLNVGITLYFWIGSIFEERKLLAEFGEAYREHQQRTPRLLPWPRPRRKPEAGG
jgi:protein-S-isoprenylcysteine O-methyltransferase Ste14